ncbi:ankyrin repeat domain-containing protein 40-like isoform X2 [Homarus americanus]|uniref:ankyrin repeat domain-containing protein 40-like isoform X2 n=1 Tax=Homarus americanus TaxID=6706 RepID=UPI001C438AEB|nr:ankyrin repeat domain-containing protein 40-like isoform X2 [Homarus americanus]
MELQKQNEEKLREACCYGDNEGVIALVTRGTNINSKHDINGWTGLHWATKRGNIETVRLLLANGADPDIENSQSQTPAQLTTIPQILQLLEDPVSSMSIEGATTNSDSLPITPSYLAHPPIDYKVPMTVKNPTGKPITNGIVETNGHPGVPSQPPSYVAAPMHSSYPSSIQDYLVKQNKELILKVRVANTDDPDFIEVDFQKAQMNYSHLLTNCCKELAVNPQLVERIRKLPNTRLRNDRDVQRLCDFMELELVIKGQNRLPVSRSDTHSTSKNNYKSIHGFKNQTILY